MVDAERYAQEFLDVADAIGQAIERTETLARLGGLRGEERAADSIVISGPEVQEALRQVAFRLDRAALLNRSEWQSRREKTLYTLIDAVKTFIDLSPTALDTSELEAAMRTARGW